jgi:cytochrome c oxidase subunit II
LLSYWLPENASSYGAQIDDLFYLIFYITGITFILVQVAMLVFLVQYRYRPGRRAAYTHGNTTLEIIWTIVPALILVLLGFMSKAVWDDIRIAQPKPDVVVGVTGKQFNWDIVYPGPDGKLETEDDKTLENDLRVPVDSVVEVHLKSKDVIHSFFVPQLRVKQDAVPGRTIPVWFKATKTGRFEIPCAELCGFGHSGMLGHVTVHTKEEYDGWLREQFPS